MSRSQTAEDRFDARYLVNAETGCWDWSAGKIGDGYGCLRVNARMTLAHRYSYTRFTGEIPPGRVICHRCDNPGCVNPAHLFVGTQSDNVADMMAKGRSRKASGEAHFRTTLTNKDVLRIAREPRTTPARALAQEFNVGTSTIKRIRTGQVWSRVTGIKMGEAA